jgi:hypothetical protein
MRGSAEGLFGQNPITAPGPLATCLLCPLWVDLSEKLIANAKALQKYCIQNPQTLVMSAVETLFGTDRK